MPPDPPSNARANGARAQAARGSFGARAAMGLQIFEILATPLPLLNLLDVLILITLETTTIFVSPRHVTL